MLPAPAPPSVDPAPAVDAAPAHLSGLSADAVPEIDKLQPKPLRDCVLAHLSYQPSAVDSWYAFNIGRSRAWTVLHARPSGGVTGIGCTYVIDPGNRHEG